ncbi:hypothetical protein HOK51_03450 [Candidatus Woesearchaeota archaeon]|jgi:hypothetical protein|nr:hypothetical protein [Candidatus Woesearchaeota archaeon]MBT6518876.1 hypothetical protein [Candidatus Woesearchaeota archaeon]MBT7368015.1 hypothetical protein [Candidatus Woesearchaeota archaeon]
MISLDPLRKHNCRVILTGGLAIEMLRLIVEFYEAYSDLMKISKKTESDSKDISKIMKNLGKMKIEEKRKYLMTNQKKKFLSTEEEFMHAFGYMKKSIRDWKQILLDDDTLIFRETIALANIQRIIKKLVIPDEQKNELIERIGDLIYEIAETQHHFWVSSKADTRGFVKLDELSLKGPRVHRRHMKRNAIEVRTIINQILRLQVEVKQVKDHIELKDKCAELYFLYHHEFQDLKHIMHSAHVILHSAEKLFKKIMAEAQSLGFLNLQEQVKEIKEEFEAMLKEIQKVSLREYLDLKKIADHAKMYSEQVIRKSNS